MRRHRSSLLVGLALVAAIAIACGGGGGDKGDSTNTPASDATQLPVTPGQSAGPNELGQAPFFLRTQDNFASLTANADYKIVIRLTSGYSEPSLTVSGQPDQGGETVQLEATKVEPQGEDLPGSYYTVNLLFPREGRWIITATADNNELTLPVDVLPAAG